MAKPKQKRATPVDPDRIKPRALPYTCPKCSVVCTPCIQTAAGFYRAICASCRERSLPSTFLHKALDHFNPKPKGSDK
jgi:hypothetical protein